MDRVQLFVPGRLCLFGEHSDWAGLQRTMNAEISPGYAIVTGIEQGIYATAEKAEQFSMRNMSEVLRDTWEDFDCVMRSQALRSVAQADDYFAYVAGVASYIEEHYNVGGMRLTITDMTLPMKSGLSSSAAICVLVARAFNLLYGLNLNTMGEMSIAFRGEQRTRSRCGRLDQACAFGVSPVLMGFDGEETQVTRVSIREPLHWVFADLRASKDTIRILADLNRCYPFPQNEQERRVHEALGSDNQRIINRALELMKTGDVEGLGLLMTEAQAIFDEKVAPASYEQLRAEKLHRVLADDTVKALSYGGKGVGSQGDGSVQFLARDAKTQQQLIQYLQTLGLAPFSLTLKPAYQVRKAIIPVAGFGTRLYPATRFLKKEMMPVMDRDGLLKPVILTLLEQAHDSGIAEICLVVGSDAEMEQYKQLFQRDLLSEHFDKLPPAQRAYEKKIRRIGDKLTFRVQRERKGFGHAVYQCRDFTEGEPVLLLLGDTIYSSNTDKTCSQQVIEAYEQCNLPVVSLAEIPLDHVMRHGILSGQWEQGSEGYLRVNRMVEKPSVEEAKKNLGVKAADGQEKFFGVFGQYVLTSSVFDALEKNIRAHKKTNGEYQLTDALIAVLQAEGLMGYCPDGEMRDVGNVEAYWGSWRG